MNRIIDSITNYLFPEVESHKEICKSDYIWILTLPSFGLSVLLYLSLHII